MQELRTEDFVCSARSVGARVLLDHSRLVEVRRSAEQEDPVLTFRVDRKPEEPGLLVSNTIRLTASLQKTCTVRQVTVTAPAEHPFFVYGVGWASLEPELSMERFALECRQLAPGDVCISLSSPSPPAAQHAKPS